MDDIEFLSPDTNLKKLLYRAYEAGFISGIHHEFSRSDEMLFMYRERLKWWKKNYTQKKAARKPLN